MQPENGIKEGRRRRWRGGVRGGGGGGGQQLEWRWCMDVVQNGRTVKSLVRYFSRYFLWPSCLWGFCAPCWLFRGTAAPKSSLFIFNPHLASIYSLAPTFALSALGAETTELRPALWVGLERLNHETHECQSSCLCFGPLVLEVLKHFPEVHPEVSEPAEHLVLFYLRLRAWK